MCNDHRLIVDIASVAEDFDDLQIKIRIPEGSPDVEARDDTDWGRSAAEDGGHGFFLKRSGAGSMRSMREKTS